MSSTFTAIDFETAKGKRWSICQVGLVRIQNGQVADELCKLVCPPNNFYHYRNSQIHGITPEDTKSSPTFRVIWPELKPYFEGQTVVVHNGAFEKTNLLYAHLKQQYFGGGRSIYGTFSQFENNNRFRKNGCP